MYAQIWAVRLYLVKEIVYFMFEVNFFPYSCTFIPFLLCSDMMMSSKNSFCFLPFSLRLSPSLSFSPLSATP